MGWCLAETPLRGGPGEEAVGLWAQRAGEEWREQAACLPATCMMARAMNCLSSGCLLELNAEACYLNFKITFFF